MNVEGTVINVLPVETGQGKNGVWVKNPYIIETGGQYSKKIALSIWGDSLPKLKEGEKVDCQIDIESREYNLRWYTEVKCFKVDIISGAANSGKDKQSDPMKDAVDAVRPQILPADHFETPAGADDLPF
jgi:hypothetical protein